VLALLTLGEGWHNNHHRFMASARHGFVQPWEIDVTFYAIKRASFLRLSARARRYARPPLTLAPDGRRAQ
jgi:stearoyl-CoA desaturase (delta-9 desaturase)